jgi:choline dehydrogenase-like flavoprotein
MPTSPINVIIIGAGTGGLCLAQGLKRAGISVAVYERDRTRADGLQGYRVGIDADGKRALRANLPPELYQTFVATCRSSSFIVSLPDRAPWVRGLFPYRDNASLGPRREPQGWPAGFGNTDIFGGSHVEPTTPSPPAQP